MKDSAAIWLSITLGLALGCQNSSSQQMPTESADRTENGQSVSANSTIQTRDAEALDSQNESESIPTISLGSRSPQQADTHQQHTHNDVLATTQQRRKLLEAMQPVQVLLGKWKGTTQKEFGDFKGLDEPEWVWDFQSDPDRPALVMHSDNSPYFHEARLTYLSENQKFELKTTDPEGKERTFVGDFLKPVEHFQGDDQQMQIRYQLRLTQTDSESARDTWQVTVNQQQNHRYLVELARKSGTNFIRFDTIATQREGTSFGVSDVGYGERECLISGGLGVTQVSYQGKSYWVCCSGCEAAFKDDPVTWIAEFQAKQKAKAEGPTK